LVRPKPPFSNAYCRGIRFRFSRRSSIIAIDPPVLGCSSPPQVGSISRPHAAKTAACFRKSARDIRFCECGSRHGSPLDENKLQGRKLSHQFIQSRRLLLILVKAKKASSIMGQLKEPRIIMGQRGQTRTQGSFSGELAFRVIRDNVVRG
jgi:hypothetical protein